MDQEKKEPLPSSEQTTAPRQGNATTTSSTDTNSGKPSRYKGVQWAKPEEYETMPGQVIIGGVRPPKGVPWSELGAPKKPNQ
jgi:hypothetical protein